MGGAGLVADYSISTPPKGHIGIMVSMMPKPIAEGTTHSALSISGDNATWLLDDGECSWIWGVGRELPRVDRYNCGGRGWSRLVEVASVCFAGLASP